MQALASVLRNKLILAVLGAAIIGSGAYAFAATLGVSSNSLGAGATTVASCDVDGVTTSFTTAYSTTAAKYVVDTVKVSGIDAACNSAKLQVTLTVGATHPEVVNVVLDTTPSTGNVVSGVYTSASLATSAYSAQSVTGVDAALSS